MKKCFILNIFILTALVLAGACSKSSSKEKLVEAESSEEFKDPPLTPVLIDEAQKAFADTYKNLKEAPNFNYTILKDVNDQGSSSLCAAFAFRDLLVNNLSVNEAKKPSIFSLLTHRRDYEGKLILSKNEGFDYDTYNVFKMGSKGIRLATENALPFDTEIYKNFQDIYNGKTYETEKYFISSSHSKSVSLHQYKESSLGLVLEVDQFSKNKVSDFIDIKPFAVTVKNISTLNFVSHMKELANALFYKKAQYVTVCASHIRGLSKKLIGKSASTLDKDVDDSDQDCGFHAILATDARIDENMIPWITIRNSWGNELSDNGTHELNFHQFVSLLAHKNDDSEDDLLSFKIISLSRVPEGQTPIHKELSNDGWQFEAKSLDGIHPFEKTKWTNIRPGSYFECDIENETATRCHGRSIWKNPQKEMRDRYYVYEGEMKVTDMLLNTFKERVNHGKGKITLWGNVIKEGTFDDGTLREGKYFQYFSKGRSAQVSYSEEGTFNENEDLVKGVRKTYNRAGDIISTKVIE